MAWKNREGGDKNHTNGVHFQQNARTKAIKAFAKDKTDARSEALSARPGLAPRGSAARLAHRAPGGAGVADAECMPCPYRTPPSERNCIASSSNPTHGAPSRTRWTSGARAGSGLRMRSVAHRCRATLRTRRMNTQQVARRIASQMRFFHWELEFPDVYQGVGSGFDAVLGNPPWDIAKPVSKEFFSNLDPLYRSYGKQEALQRQTGYFGNPQRRARLAGLQRTLPGSVQLHELRGERVRRS